MNQYGSRIIQWFENRPLHTESGMQGKLFSRTLLLGLILDLIVPTLALPIRRQLARRPESALRIHCQARLTTHFAAL